MTSFLDSLKHNWSLFVIKIKADLAKKQEQRHISKLAYEAEMLKQLPGIAKAKAQADAKKKINAHKASAKRPTSNTPSFKLPTVSLSDKQDKDFDILGLR